MTELSIFCTQRSRFKRIMFFVNPFAITKSTEDRENLHRRFHHEIIRPEITTILITFIFTYLLIDEVLLYCHN